MSDLFIVAASGEWRVWPDPEPVPPGAVQETRAHLFELRHSDTAEVAELLIDDVPLEALRAPANTARWRWTPGFHAGEVEAELRAPGQPPRRFQIITDPDERKLSRNDFDGMVREVLEDTFALFSLSSFRKGVASGAGTRAPPLARLEFLRSRAAELEAVIEEISRKPRRRLAAEEVLVPYYRAIRATGPEILRSMRSGRVLQETGSPGRLPSPLRGFLPEIIRTRRGRNSLDLPEHRQMRACLRSWSAWMDGVADLLALPEQSDDIVQRSRSAWADRCRRIARRLAGLASSPLFEGVGQAPPRLVLTSLFKNDGPYRRFYRIWQDVERGIAAVFGEFLNMPLARTFDLYELWCFLRLIRASRELQNSSSVDAKCLWSTDNAGRLTIPTGTITVATGPDWVLHFQKEYREFWIEPDGRGSYSRSMRPDIVVAWEEGKSSRLIVLDAKYRIGEGLSDALASIHMYRDALVKGVPGSRPGGIVTAAYLLTPHVPELLGKGYRDMPMPGRLFHPEYRGQFRFGAMTMRPGMSVNQIAAGLQQIISDAKAAN